MKIIVVIIVAVINQMFIQKTVIAYEGSNFFNVNLEQVGSGWQVKVINPTTSSNISLSNTRNNSNIVTDHGNVVWEGFVDNAWQIFLFNGFSVTQISSGDNSIKPFVAGNFVVFGRRGGGSDWCAELYNITTGESVKVAVGLAAKKPELRNGEVVLTGKGYDEPTGIVAEYILPSKYTDTIAYVTESDIKLELGIID